jgi:hypothetical protein
MYWSKEFEKEIAAMLDNQLLAEPEYLLAKPQYGAPVHPVRAAVCIHRRIGFDEQYERDLFSMEFRNRWLVPKWHRASALQYVPDVKTDLDAPDVSVYHPLNIVTCMVMSPEVVEPPFWLRELDDDYRYTVWLVRYVRVG